MASRWLSVIVLAASGCFIKPDPPPPTPPDAPSPRPNFVFATSMPIMLMLGWSTNSTNADAQCNDLAATAGLSGRYMAWLSGDVLGSGAAERLKATGARGWIMPDAELFADTVDDIAAFHLLGAPHVDEHGADVGSMAIVATGTARNGTAVMNRDASCNSIAIEFGEPFVVDTWTSGGTIACTAPDLRIYCFGTDFNHQVP